MTRARVTAAQAARPPKGARLLRGTVSAVSPLTVSLAGGTAVPGLQVPGAAYNVGDTVLVVVQEPGVGPVYPLPGGDGIVTGAVSYATNVAHADVASGQTSSVSRIGRHGLLNVNLTVSAATNQGTTLLTLPTGFVGVAGIRQQGTFMWKGAGVGQNMSGTAVAYVLGNALVFYQWFGTAVSGQLGAGGSFHGSLPYLIA